MHVSKWSRGTQEFIATMIVIVVAFLGAGAIIYMVRSTREVQSCRNHYGIKRIVDDSTSTVQNANLTIVCNDGYAYNK